MNEATYLLAVLVIKGIVTKKEALLLKRSMTEGVINSDLNQMLAKVEKALVPLEKPLETIDAKTLINGN